MRDVWLGLTSTDPEVAYKRYARQLNRDYFYSVFPSPLAAYCSKIVENLAAANGAPVRFGKCGADLPGARVCDRVLEISHLEECLLEVRYSVRDYGVKTYALTVRCGCGESREVFRAHGNVLMQNSVDVEREAPVEAGGQLALELPEPDQESPFKRVDDDARNQRLEARLDDLEDFIKHESPQYPWG